MHPLLFPLLFWTLGYSTAQDLTGPETVRGQEMGSLMVACHYDSGWKTYKKYWCRGAQWSRCRTLVTTKSEQLVKKDRVSIKDNQKSFVFTVTMENLRRTDAGTYWCGIERIGTDHRFEVNVFIDPAPTTVLTTMPTITTTTAPILVEETSILPTSYHSDSRHSILELSVLLPVIAAAVLVLLLVMASLLAWRMTRRQKKAAGLPPEQAPQSLDGDLCYANLTLQQSRTDPGSSRKKVSTRTSSCGQTNQAEVAYVTMAPFPREEISYASLSLDNLDREPVYSNTDHLVTHIPSMSQEVSTEYSSIRRP